MPCRFSSITINLGPTFLSGALAANSEIHLNKPSCPLIQVKNIFFVYKIYEKMALYHNSSSNKHHWLPLTVVQSNLDIFRVHGFSTHCEN